VAERSRHADETQEQAFSRIFAQAFQGLSHELKGGQDTIQISGFTCTRRPGDWLVVVRGYSMVEGRAVVTFGAGDSLFLGLRNVSIAIAKGQWRADKYAK
jgi:hypothetical protein